LRLDPIDPSELHLQLATTLEEQGDLPAAKRHALLALEETPRFRKAYARLFAINARLTPRTSDGISSPPPPPESVPLEDTGSVAQ
jgi:hypothetical protein